VPEREEMMRHMLATLAYRTQKALQGAPPGFARFEAGAGVRTPHALVNHMTHLIGYTLSGLRGDAMTAVEELDDFSAEVERFHGLLEELSGQLTETSFEQGETADRLLQGPLSDAMTHVGQLALLRRLAASPVAPENYFRASISRDNLSADQPLAEPARSTPSRKEAR